MGENCLFCSIVNGEIPAQVVYTSETIVAFKDLNPQAPTHILIIPKKHIPSLDAAADQEGPLLGQIQLVAKRLAQQLQLSGFRLVLNNGKIASQSVDHVHYHLLGGRRMNWPPG